MIIGINGRPGSGKTTVSKLICSDKDKEIIHLDCAFNEIKNKYLKNKVTLSENIDGDSRPYVNDNSPLKKIVASKSLLWLKKIYTKRYVKNKIDESTKEYIILEGRQLNIYDLEKLCDVKIFVHSPNITRYERVKKRDNFIEEDTIIKDLNKELKEKIDTSNYHVLFNISDLETLKEEIKVLEKKLKI